MKTGTFKISWGLLQVVGHGVGPGFMEILGDGSRRLLQGPSSALTRVPCCRRPSVVRWSPAPRWTQGWWRRALAGERGRRPWCKSWRLDGSGEPWFSSAFWGGPSRGSILDWFSEATRKSRKWADDTRTRHILTFSLVQLGSLTPIPFRNGDGSIPMNTIFRGLFTSIYQLFWCELQGYKVLTHCQIGGGTICSIGL